MQFDRRPLSILHPALARECTSKADGSITRTAELAEMIASKEGNNRRITKIRTIFLKIHVAM